MRGRGLRVLTVGLFAVAMVLAGPPEAHAANRFLTKAKRAYKNLRYDDVLPLLKKALRIAKADGEKIEIYAMMAEMHVTYSRDVQARQAYVQLLAIKPDFMLPEDSSPKLLSVFEEARAEAGGGVVSSGEPTGGGPPGDGGGEVGGGTSDTGSADTASADAGGGDDTTTTTGGGSEATDTGGGEGSGDATGGGDATTEIAATGVGTTGGPTDPMPITRVDAPQPIVSQWWFWTAVGVVVIGGAAAGTLLLTRGPNAPNGDFGPYNLP